MLKLYFRSLLIGGFIFFFVAPFVHGAYAAVLKFNPTSTTVNNGDTFQVEIQIDSSTEQVAGTDVYVIYDATSIAPQSVGSGTHFPIVTNNIGTGKVSISAVVDNPSDYKTGIGSIANITFKTLKGGSGTITFACDLAQAETSKIYKNDLSATNIIDCGGLNSYTYSVNGGTSTGGTTTGGGTIATGGTGTTTTGTGTNGTYTSSTGGTYYTSTGGTPKQLPQSGILEDVAKFSVPGVLLIVVGVGLRLLVLL
jgi:hypothetical protein